MTAVRTNGLFALYVPTMNHPVMGLQMEWFTSIPVCEKELIRRTRTGRGQMHTDRSMKWMPPSMLPHMEWPLFDESGYMRVWRASRYEMWPDVLSLPDEEWVTTEYGEVERIEWTDSGPEHLYLANGGAWVNSKIVR